MRVRESGSNECTVREGEGEGEESEAGLADCSKGEGEGEEDERVEGRDCDRIRRGQCW